MIPVRSGINKYLLHWVLTDHRTSTPARGVRARISSSERITNITRPGPTVYLASIDSKSLDCCASVTNFRSPITCSSAVEGGVYAAATIIRALLLSPCWMRKTLMSSSWFDSDSWLHVYARCIETSLVLAATSKDLHAWERMYSTLRTFPSRLRSPEWAQKWAHPETCLSEHRRKPPT